MREGQSTEDSHRFYALTRSPTDIKTEHAVTSPFSLASQAIEAHYVTQSSLYRTALEVDPIKRCRAMAQQPYGRGGRLLRLERASRYRIHSRARSRRRMRRRGSTVAQIRVILRNKHGSHQRNEFLVCDVGDGVVVYYGAGVGVICKAM